MKLMVDDILLDNYLLWERILEVLVLRQDYANLLLFTRNIVACLQKLAYENKPLSRKAKVCRRDLVRVFYADLCRVMALVWGGKSEKIIKQVCEIFKQVKLENSNTDININFNSNIDTTFDEKAIFSFRKLYCYSRILNKYMQALCRQSLLHWTANIWAVSWNSRMPRARHLHIHPIQPTAPIPSAAKTARVRQ